MQNSSQARSAIPAALEHFELLPESAEVRVPVVAALWGCSIGTVWRRVRNGDLPQPIRRNGITTWRVGALREAKAAA